MKQEKIYLKDYLSPAYSIESVNLDFILNEDFCRVTARSEVTRLRSEDLKLNGEELKLISVKINNRSLNVNEYEVNSDLMLIKDLPEKFTLEIETQLQPQHNTALDGLYKSNDIFCTQCEAESFRKITYFLDRPDVMTSYSVSIEADKLKYPILLSNGDRIKMEDLANGRHKAYWQDPHKKPSYLFALVAGDLGVIKDYFVTKSGRKVNLEVYAAHGKQERCWHAMQSLKKSMKWDEDTYGLEYDLNDYMIVAIDDFNAGAMENKGLNVFNSRLVLADKNSATDDDFHAIESVVAHEYFHNWTGNRVTLRDWFQLSLKEGLTVFRDQEFSADMMDRGVQRIEDVDSLRSGQFAEDAGPNAHPVRPESCLSVDNFFTMTIYEKGAEVIRMMQNIVGRKGFRKGMDEYFRRHDGQAVTTDDFAAAIAESNGKNFSQFKLWYHQAGTPEVIAQESFDSAKGEYSLNLSQHCPPTPGQLEKKPFHIPLMIGLLDPNGNELPIQCSQVSQNTDGKYLVELTQAKENFIFTGLKIKPHLSILREFSAPVNLKWQTDDDSYYFLMEKDKDSFNRREAAQKMSLKALSVLIAQFRNNQKPTVDAKLIRALSIVIQDESLDPAFKSKILQPPSYAMLAQQENILDSEAFFRARTELKLSIARENRLTLINLYKRSHLIDDSKHRMLKATALSYLMELNESEVWGLIVDQYQTAQNMTDRMNALNLLSHTEIAQRALCLDNFYQEWKSDTLVMNKWFAVQAMSSRPGTLEEVRSLCSHPSFNISNPNNVYSLLRAFSANLVRFHDPNVDAYSFYADKIIEVDKKNPQVASRLCAAFNFVKKLEPKMQDRAMNEIKRMVTVPGLSKNSRELLESVLQ